MENNIFLEDLNPKELELINGGGDGHSWWYDAAYFATATVMMNSYYLYSGLTAGHQGPPLHQHH